MRIIALGKDGDRVIDAAPVDIGAGDEQFAAHRAIDGTITGFAWSVSHIATGFRLASGNTAREAVEKAEVEWKAKTPGQRAAALDHARSLHHGEPSTQRAGRGAVMTRARHVTPGQTAARIERLRMLITTLQVRQLLRDELGDILKVGPSGVRKYLKDLRGKVELTIDAGNMVCRLAMSPEESKAYLATLATQIPVRQAAAPRSAFRHAAQDPARHFHILADDEHYAIRVSGTPVARDPLVAAFFGAGCMEARA